MITLNDLKEPNRQYGCVAGFNSAEEFEAVKQQNATTEVRRAVPRFADEPRDLIKTPEQYRLEGFNQAVKVIDLFASRHFGPTHVFRTLLQVLVKTTEL